MSIVNNKKVIIAAIASRPYVEAAVMAGYEVFAIDAFADLDLQSLATCTYQVDICDNQLDQHQLLGILDDLDLQQFLGFCYGAGFEKQAKVLTAVNQRIEVLGNTAQTVERCKAPDYFFNQCDYLQISYPAVMGKQSESKEEWVRKEIGGSGGEHIKRVFEEQKIQSTDCYYQKIEAGKTVSCLFLASEHGVQVVGFSEQWSDNNDEAPFRYGGAVSDVIMNETTKKCFIRYIEKLAQTLGLVGLNSCDAICNEDDIKVLEINPRLSATIDLYMSTYPDLFTKHLKACRAEELVTFDIGEQRNKAHHVIYAQKELMIKNAFLWPDWVVDIPKAGSIFKMGMPVCTVLAKGSTAIEAKSLVQERAAALNLQILN